MTHLTHFQPLQYLRVCQLCQLCHIKIFLSTFAVWLVSVADRNAIYSILPLVIP